MKNLLKTLEGLPWIVRVLLVLFCGLYGNFIRLLRSLIKGNVLGIVLSAILLCCGGFVVLWVIDLIFVLTNRPLWWID